MELALHNLINNMYSKDISVKIRSSIKTRNKRGQYWGGQAFYGYKLHPKDKHRLVVDEDVRGNIELIYDMCISGMSTMEIAKELNERGIPCPAAHKRNNGSFYNGRVIEDNPIWIGGTVRKILNDERYTGKMICGTRETVGIHTNKMRTLPKEQWIVVDGTHEAIISDETFSAAGESMKSRLRTVNTNTAGDRKHNLFVCGHCGKKLQRSNAKDVHLYCIRARHTSSPECEQVYMSEKVLKSSALSVIS